MDISDRIEATRKHLAAEVWKVQEPEVTARDTGGPFAPIEFRREGQLILVERGCFEDHEKPQDVLGPYDAKAGHGDSFRINDDGTFDDLPACR